MKVNILTPTHFAETTKCPPTRTAETTVVDTKPQQSTVDEEKEVISDSPELSKRPTNIYNTNNIIINTIYKKIVEK